MKLPHPVFTVLFALAISLPMVSRSDNVEQSEAGRPTFVLVHGTFQWGGQWNLLADYLRRDGYTVHAPSLTGLGEREHLLSKQTGLSTHIEDITNYISWLGLDNVILVAHSYGGAVITGAADDLGDRISHLVYIDTVPLNHGENLLDVFGSDVEAISRKSVEEGGDGWLIPDDALRPPLSTMRSHPWKTYTDRIDLNHAPPESGTIIVATEAADVFGYMRTQQAPKRAEVRGWSLHTVEGPHALQETSPSMEEIADILLQIANPGTGSG